jgi:starch synthase
MADGGSWCGVPVVSTYSGGIPEYVEHGRTGILVARGEVTELARAIGQVLDDTSLARAMGEAGRQREIEHFSWDVISRRLADLIVSVSLVQGTQSDIVNRTAERVVS